MENSQLPPSAVRWYSYKAPHTAKALKDQLDIPHRGFLLRFCDADNLALETSYRSIQEELERSWWEEEAAFTASPGKKKKKEQQEPITSPQQDETSSWSRFMHPPTSGEAIGIQVRSGAYEVNLHTRIIKPSYWPAPTHRILRGTWFAEKGQDWVPLREPLADQIEQAYTSSIWDPRKGLLQEQSDGRPGARLNLISSSSSSSSSASNLSAVFINADEIYLEQGSSFGWLLKLGTRSTSSTARYRLRRGYQPPTTPLLLSKEADIPQESIDERAAAIKPTHVVFVVHGIGQTLSSADIGHDALLLRTALQQIEKDLIVPEQQSGSALPIPENQVPASESSLQQQEEGTVPKSLKKDRVFVVPVQWRRTVSLEVDTLAASLRPPGIPALRQVLHSTAMEVLLYLTPLHRADILSSLVSSLDAAYSRFRLRNPDFNGPVSILAHSLGSVLCWDILCNQQLSTPSVHTMRTDTTTTTDMDFVTDTRTLPHKNHHHHHHQQSTLSGDSTSSHWSVSPVAINQLQFNVDRLILAGSPLGCFLALRGINQSKGRGLGTRASSVFMQCHPDRPPIYDGLPKINRLYNLYHPYDPVSYKLEPLAYPQEILARHRPAMAQLAGGGRRLHIAAQELGDTMSLAAGKIGSTLVGAFSFGSRKKSTTAAGGAATASTTTTTMNTTSTTMAGRDTVGKSRSATPSPVKKTHTYDGDVAGDIDHISRVNDSTRSDISMHGKEWGDIDIDRGSLVTPPISPIKPPAQGSGYDMLEGGDDENVEGGPCLDQDRVPMDIAVEKREQGEEGMETGGGGISNLSHMQNTTTTATSTTISRVAGGDLTTRPGGWPTDDIGRIDFSLQEASLESQYLSALSAHFVYWSSPDVALFVHRAVRGVDVLTGSSAPPVGGAVDTSRTLPDGGIGAVGGGNEGGIVEPRGEINRMDDEVRRNTNVVERMVQSWNYQ